MGGRGCAAEAPSSGGRSRRAAAAAKVYLQLCVRMGGASSAGALPAVSRYRGVSHRSRPDGWVSLSAGGRCSRAGTRWGQEGGSSGGAWGGGHLSAPRCRAQSTGPGVPPVPLMGRCWGGISSAAGDTRGLWLCPRSSRGAGRRHECGTRPSCAPSAATCRGTGAEGTRRQGHGPEVYHLGRLLPWGSLGDQGLEAPHGAGLGAVTAESDFDAPGRGGPGQEESVPAGV